MLHGICRSSLASLRLSCHAGNFSEDYPENYGSGGDAKDGPTSPQGNQRNGSAGPEPATHERFVQYLFVGKRVGAGDS